jgi:phage tail sheath protein FI
LILPIHPLDLDGSGLRIATLRGGADGLAALRAVDFTGEPGSPEDSDAVRSHKERGITALSRIDEIAIVAVPDIHIRPRPAQPPAPIPLCIPDPCLPSGGQPPVAAPKQPAGDAPPTFSDEEVFAVQTYLIDQCEELRDRFAVLDAPYSAAKNDKLGTAAIRQWRSRFDSTFAALYYPWLKVLDPFRNPQSLTREIPPSGHVAGVFARGDVETGVHKAPANVGLSWAEDLTAHVGDAEQGVLNPLGINALRSFPGRGIRIHGARTMSSDPAWRFVNVRRLLMMIEESIDEALQWVVFEPNDHITRTKVALTLRSFLLSLWQRGALMGPTESDAFFVKCNDVNNPAAERDNGRLLAEVGVAASQPFEFVVLRLGRENNALEIAEAGIVAVRG